ncbi:MAG: hypothetical protein ACPHSF_08895, partial [Flavobacteriales bacterium]
MEVKQPEAAFCCTFKEELPAMLTPFFTCTLRVARYVQAGFLIAACTACCSVVSWGQTPCEGGLADGFPC